MKSLTEVETPDIREALPAVAPAHDDHDVPDQVRRVVPARRRPLAPRLDMLPPHALRRPAHVEGPNVVQRRGSVPSAENPELALVEHGCVGPTRWRDDGALGERWTYPAAHDGVEDVDVVVIRRALAAADDNEFAIDKCGTVRSAGGWYIAHDLGVGPLHCFYCVCVSQTEYKAHEPEMTRGDPCPQEGPLLHART